MSEQMLLDRELAYDAAERMHRFVTELTSSLEMCRQARNQVTIAANYAAQNGDNVLALERRRRFIVEVRAHSQ